MTLAFSNGIKMKPTSDSGGGSVSFTYPYCYCWILKTEAYDNSVYGNLDWTSLTNEQFQEVLLFNLGQATVTETSETGLTATYNGQTLELYEDTNEESNWSGAVIGTYGQENVMVCDYLNIGGDSPNACSFQDFKQTILGIGPEPDEPLA